MLNQKNEMASSNIAWETPAVMAFNFFSAVSIIFVNKMIFKSFSFPFATFLTGLHFVITFVGLLFLKRIHFFEVKAVEVKEVIPLCFAFCGFVIFNNLSLQENTVGFYQIMKVMTTPVVAIIQYSLYSIAMAKQSVLALITVCVGIAIVTCNEIELRPWGFIYACCGVLCTSFYQVWVKSRQQDLGLSPPQLLFYQAPISAILVFLITPFFDNVFGDESHYPSLMSYSFTDSNVCIFIGISCLLAFCVNLSIFLTIGRTSPITYNVLGHFKLCLITVGGTFFFNEDMNHRKGLGLAVALLGIGVYTYLKLKTTSNNNSNSTWEKRAKGIVRDSDNDGNKKNETDDDFEHRQPLIISMNDSPVRNEIGVGITSEVVQGNNNSSDSSSHSKRMSLLRHLQNSSAHRPSVRATADGKMA